MADSHTPGIAAGWHAVTRVRVEPGLSRTKLVSLPVLDLPVLMGMHGAVAEHYRVRDGEYEPHATTLDYLVGAAVACLTGTFGGMLDAYHQSIDGGRLVAEGEGSVVAERGTLRVRAVHVLYRLRLDAGVDVSAVHRAHERHVARCPIARSVMPCIDITTELVLE